jgi:hypothetical protein
MEYEGALNFGKSQPIMKTAGVRGTRSHVVERTRMGLIAVGGSVNLIPGPADLDLLLRLITGSTKSGNNFAIAETIEEFYVGVDKIAAQYLYSGCKIMQATFSGSTGSFLSLTCDIIGKTETAGTISGLSALVPSLATPYVFHDATLSYGGTSYQFKEFSFVFNNGLKADRYMNSITRTDIPELDRVLTISLGLPFTSDTLALYDIGITSAQVVLTFTNGGYVFTITLPAVQFPTQVPSLPGREEIILPLSGQAMKTGTTLECTFTNDVTP